MVVLKTKWQSALSAAITASATTAYVNSVSDIPTATFYAIIDSGLDSEEVVAVTVVTTATKALTITRAQHSTTAVAHAESSLIYQAEIETADIEPDAIDGTKVGDDAINSEHIAAGAIDLEHMSANSVDSDQYVDGSIDSAHIGADQVDSQHYAADSIDKEHLASEIYAIEHFRFSGNVQNDTLMLGRLWSAGTVVRVCYATESALGTDHGIDILDGATDGSGTDVIDACSNNLNGNDVNDLTTPYALSADDYLMIKFDAFGADIMVSVDVQVKVPLGAAT